MKLYTTEQVYEIMAEAFSEGVLHGRNPNYKDFSYDNFLKVVTPIQLPKDEEIEKYIKSFPYTKHLDDGQYNDGVLVGAELGIEWVIDKIKNQQQ